MKIPFFRVLAAVAAITFASPALFAQEADNANPPAGLSEDQALELARIVNAADPGELKLVISNVVDSVLTAADDQLLAAGQISAALAAAIVARNDPNTPELLAELVMAISSFGSGDSATALAERAAAAIVAATGSKSFLEFLPESIAAAAADASDDPLSVITAKDASALKDLFKQILEILTPGAYETRTDVSALFVKDTSSPAGRALAEAEAAAAASSSSDKSKPSKPSKKDENEHRRPSPTPVGRR